MGDRLTAGLWTLDPSIGVRIPVPQLSRGGFFAPAFQLPLLGFVTDVNLFDHGACSSMAEHLIVDQDVVGSSPIKRPSTFPPQWNGYLLQKRCSSFMGTLLFFV